MKTIRLAREQKPAQGGFSLAEMTVLLAVIGSLCVLSLPIFLSYYQSAQVRSAASDVAGFVNQGRQLAIQRNQSVCVSIGSTAVQYRLGSCGGTVWTGAITTSAGNVNTPDGITLTTTANPVFSNLGAATPAATITVSQGTRTLSVVVASSGRVSLGP